MGKMQEIYVEGLTKKFSKNVGIFDLRFEVSSGEVFGFLGPNGAGKTTTIRHLMGFCRPDKGDVRVKGLESYKKYSEIMKSVGYLPGEISLPAALTGTEFIAMMRDLRKCKDTTYLNSLLERFELDPNIETKKMSLGTKRKLAIVTAFMCDPEILILDEPTSGLDPVMQDRFIKFIKEEKRRGKTIFLSSHIFSEIDASCDRIAIIKQGRIINTFIADDLKHNKNKTYVIEFYSRDDYNEFINMSFDVAHAEPDRMLAKVCINDEDINALIASTAHMSLKNFAEVVFSLEDYFMQFYRQEKEYEGIDD